MPVRIAALIAVVIAIILFAVGATANATTSPTAPGHDLLWGLVALAAAIGLLILDPVINRVP